MRKSSAANSAASSPPVPARISRIALRSSASSLGSSSTFTCCSSCGSFSFSACNSFCASVRISGSPPSSARADRSAISACTLRSAAMPSTTGVRSLYSARELRHLAARQIGRAQRIAQLGVAAHDSIELGIQRALRRHSVLSSFSPPKRNSRRSRSSNAAISLGDAPASSRSTSDGSCSNRLARSRVAASASPPASSSA